MEGRVSCLPKGDILWMTIQVSVSFKRSMVGRYWSAGDSIRNSSYWRFATMNMLPFSPIFSCWGRVGKLYEYLV